MLALIMIATDYSIFFGAKAAQKSQPF